MCPPDNARLRAWFSLCFALVAPLLLSCLCGHAATQPADKPKQAPWQQRLRGADETRIRKLETEFEKLRDEASYRQALPIAQEILAIRTRVQGADHWETVLARWRLKTTERVLSVSYFDLAKLRVADGEMQEAERLWRQGKFAEAETLQRQALVVGRQVLSEEFPLYADGYEMLAMIMTGQG